VLTLRQDGRPDEVACSLTLSLVSCTWPVMFSVANRVLAATVDPASRAAAADLPISAVSINVDSGTDDVPEPVPWRVFSLLRHVVIP
jgi:hypothetical protein